MMAARRESKGRRQKARQQARFFKEIDTTLEALGIGTAPDPGVSAAGGSLSGLPPSPVSSTLSLTLALSSDAQLAALATPTALSSRAGTPPPGPGAGGSVTAASAAAGGPGDFNRRVTSDLSLRSLSDLNSGCSTPERLPSTAGMASVGLTPPPLGSWVTCTRTTHHDGSRSSFLGITTENTTAAGVASPMRPPPLPPRGPQVSAGAVPAAPAAAAAAGGGTHPLTMAFPGQPHPAPLDRRRTVPQVAIAAATQSTAVPTAQSHSHRRSVSYEGETAAAAVAATTEGGNREAAAAAPAGAVPYHPTPVRGGWAAVVMSLPPAAVPSTATAAAALGGVGGCAAGAVITGSTATEGLPPPTSATSRSYGALTDRDAFRRQLGSVLVGHGCSVEELQSQVEEVEERAESLEEEIGALADAAARMEAQLHTLLDLQDAHLQLLSPGLHFPTRGDLADPFSWHELSEQIAALDEMYRKVKEVLRRAKPLSRSHLAEDPDLLPRLHALALRLLGGLAEAAEALGRAACWGVRGLGLGVCGGAGRQAGEDEVRLGGKTVRRLLDAVDHISKKISDDLGGKTNVEAREMLKKCQEISLELARAGIQAAEVAAPGLLAGGSLGRHSLAHEKSNQAKRLIALWDEAARQTDRIAKRYNRQRLSLYGQLCDAYEKAGLQALDMTRGSVQGPPGAEDGNTADDATTTEGATSGDEGGDRLDLASSFESDVRGDAGGGGSGVGNGGTAVAWGGGAAGAWGGGGPGLGRQCRGASAAEVEAHAWMPSLFQVLLSRASEAHRNLRNELASVDGVANSLGGGASDEAAAAGLSAAASAGALDPHNSGSGSWATAGMSYELSDELMDELWGLLDEMQQTFAELCLANLRRTVWLCAGGSGPLPLWALESVRDSAEAALRFIHTHEHSSMALGDMLAVETELGDETQTWLHCTWNDYTTLTRRVVDGLLSVRRQINVRRTVTSGMGPEPANRGAMFIGAARGNNAVASGYGRGQPVLTAAAALAMPPGRQQPAGQAGRGQGVGFWARGGAPGAPVLIGAEAQSGRQQAPPSLPLPYMNTPSQQQQVGQQQQQLPSTVAGSDPWVRGTTTAAAVTGESGVSKPPAVPAAAAIHGSGVGGSSAWKDALLAQHAAAAAASAADGLVRTGRASIDAAGPTRSAQPAVAVATATATATAAAAADMHGRLHTSTSSSRLSATPGPNSGTQRRVAAAAAARSAAAASRAGGGRHGGGGRGRGRLNGRGRSRQREPDDADEPMPPPPKLPPPPPPLYDTQGELPPGLDPWPRLRPHLATDAGSACGAPDDVSDVSSTTTAAAVAATSATLPLAISVPLSSRPTSPLLATWASPPSPSQLQMAGGLSWASVARGSGGGVTPLTAAPGQRPSTAGSTGGGGGTVAIHTTPLKSPVEIGAAAQQASAVAAVEAQATAAAATTGFISSPFKALAQQMQSRSPSQPPRLSSPPSPEFRPGGVPGGSGARAAAGAATDPNGGTGPRGRTPSAGGSNLPHGSGELYHLLRNQQHPSPTTPTAPLLPPHSPVQPGRHSVSVSVNVDVGSAQESGPCSFQFATGAAGPAASGRCGTAAAATSTGNSGCSSPVDRGGGGGGHRTPRLGSPHGSGSVTLAATAAANYHGGANGTGPQINGHTANGVAHHYNQHCHHNGTAFPPPYQPQQAASPAITIETSSTAATTAPHVLHNTPSLSTALSLGHDGQGLARYGSYSLQGFDSFGGRGGGGAVQEESSLLADPEVAELFRSIARDPFCGIRWQDLSHGLRRGLSDIVGSGSIGQVFAGMYLHGEVAIKVIDINRETKYDLRALRAFKHEVDLNKRLNQHPNIVRFIGVCAEYIQHAARQSGLLGDGPDPGDSSGAASGPTGHRLNPVSGPPMLAIVMEYCPMGTLYNMIGAAREAQKARQAGLTRGVGPRWGRGTDFLQHWTRRLEVLKGAAAGLEYMHRCDVIHHDFTSYNLLLEEKNGRWNTKVCDFNLSRVIARGRPGAALAVPNSGGAWSPRWQSPEYLAGHDYSCPTDVFSFAVVIWEVVTLQRPWDAELQDARCESMAMIRMYAEGKRLEFPKNVQPDLPVLQQIKELCERCWLEEPQERPSMRQVADELMRLHKVVQEYERRIVEETRAAA
ncbi:hypothetical protein VaNZ11_012881, partial [Volvox africanus]